MSEAADDIVLAHPIDPMVDVVFKALFGNPARTGLLVDFLNAVLHPAIPFVDVQLADPAGERLGAVDKAVTLDVKARDASGRAFDVEVQRWRHPALAERAVYYWSSLYTSQLIQGDGYTALAPAVSIWIMGEPLWADRGAHQHFELREVHSGERLTDHCGIHFLQPRRWAGSADSALSSEDAWLCFFRDAAQWTRLPPALATSTPMRQAMSVLRQFSEVELDRLDYIRRRDSELLQRTMASALAKAERAAAEADQRAEEQRQRAEEQRQRAEEQQQRAEEQRQRAEEQQQRADQADQRAEGAEAANERLRAKLRSLGIDTDA